MLLYFFRNKHRQVVANFRGVFFKILLRDQLLIWLGCTLRVTNEQECLPSSAKYCLGTINAQRNDVKLSLSGLSVRIFLLYPESTIQFQPGFTKLLTKKY